MSMRLSHSSSLRPRQSVLNCAPRDSVRSLAPTVMASGHSSMYPTSLAAIPSWLHTLPRSVAPVDRYAGDLAGGVEPLDGRLTVGVGLDPAHDVVLPGADADGLAGYVHTGEVAADIDDLPQRLECAPAGNLRDVEGEAAVGEAPALVDLGLLGLGDHIARGELELVGRVLLHAPLALRVE